MVCGLPALSTLFCFPSTIFVLNRYSLIVCKYECALAWNFRLHYLFMAVKLWGAEFLSAVFLWWTRKGSIVSTARGCTLKYRSAKLRLILIFVVCSKSWHIIWFFESLFLKVLANLAKTTHQSQSLVFLAKLTLSWIRNHPLEFHFQCCIFAAANTLFMERCC